MGSYIESDKSTYQVAAGASIKSRDMIYINAGGFAAPAAAPTASLTGTVMGSSIEDVDNTAGADGDLSVTVEHSLGGQKAFLLTASGIVAGDSGKACYVGATPKTVSLTSANAIKAGTIQGVEPDGRVRVIFPL